MRSEKCERDNSQFSESKVVQIKAQVVPLIVQLKGNTVYSKNVRLNLEGFWVQAYWWLWVARLWKILQQHWHKWQCSFSFHFSPLDGRTSRAKLCIRLLKHPCNVKEIQRVSSLWRTRQYTVKQQHWNISQIHQLLIKTKTKERPDGKILFVFVCFRQSQVKWWGSWGQMIRRCHKATTVHGCLSLQGSTPLLSW